MFRKFAFGLIVAICGLSLGGLVRNEGVLAQNATNSSPQTLIFPGVAFARSSVVLVSATGRHRFSVEVAATEAQRRMGLMNRPELNADSGMLFDFETSRHVAMWMKNTLIPLDMIFITADGRISRIEKNTEPHSLRVISSGGDVRAVLEINAGISARLKLKPGDRVEYGIFKNGNN